MKKITTTKCAHCGNNLEAMTVICVSNGMTFCNELCANDAGAAKLSDDYKSNSQCRTCKTWIPVSNEYWSHDYAYCSSACCPDTENMMKKKLITCMNCGNVLASSIYRKDSENFCDIYCYRQYTDESVGRPPVFAMPFVKSYDTANTGGGCQVDCITLHNGMVIGIDSETIVLYKGQPEFDGCEGDILGEMTIPDPRDLCDKQYEAFLKKYDWINPTLSCEDLVSTLHDNVPDDISDELNAILKQYYRLEE